MIAIYLIMCFCLAVNAGDKDGKKITKCNKKANCNRLQELQNTQESMAEKLQDGQESMMEQLKQLQEQIAEVKAGCLVEVCPDDWIRFNGSCYFFSEEKATFEEAKEYCQQQSSIVVEVKNANENTFLANHIRGTSGDDTTYQWVNKVSSFSSQYNTAGWSANQVIGEPNVYPRYGDIQGSWAQQTLDANQFLELQFRDAVYVTGIAIYETYHAGGVKAVYAKTPSGEWSPLWTTATAQVIKSSRIFSPPVKASNFQTRDIRINIDCTVSKTWVEIDAVKLTGKRSQSDESTWIGATFSQEEFTWIWASSRTGLSYTNWGTRDPSSALPEEDCAELVKSGHWNDKECNQSLHYVCEKRLT